MGGDGAIGMPLREGSTDGFSAGGAAKHIGRPRRRVLMLTQGLK